MMAFDLVGYIDSFMRRRSLTQRQLLDIVGGGNQTTVTAWKRGAIPSDDKLRILAKEDGLDPDTLVIQCILNDAERRGVDLVKLADPQVWKMRNQNVAESARVILIATGTHGPMERVNTKGAKVKSGRGDRR